MLGRLKTDWVADRLAAVPLAWRGRVEKLHGQRMSAAAQIEPGTGRRSDAERAANLWLAEVTERMEAIKIPLTLSDAELCELARRCAKECIGQAFDPGTVTDTGELRRQMAEFVRRYGIEPPEPERVCPVTGECRGVSDRGAIRRMADDLWWRRRLRVAQGRAIEREAIQLGYVSRNREMYASDVSVERRAQQKRRNASALENTLAVNQCGDEFTLAELAARAVSNPKIRRGELMTRIRGFESVAVGLGHVAEFWTVTVPSRMHRKTTAGERVIDNPKYDGTTPKAAQGYLARAWAAFRSACHRRGLSMYGFRIAEPHHDATPHWHLLLFVAPFLSAGRRAVPRLRALMRRYLVKDLDATEPKLAGLVKRAPGYLSVKWKKDRTALQTAWAWRVVSAWRVARRREENADKARKAQAAKFIEIDPEKGTAAGYIAKYVAKNIDGGGYQVQGDIEGGDAGAVTPSHRVEAWAAQWGIRQFQQIGGAPVGVWRELRRLKAAPEHSPVLEAARIAADVGEWARYTEVMGGAILPRKDRPVKVERAPDGERFDVVAGVAHPLPMFEAMPLNRYGEVAAGRVWGVRDCSKGRAFVTRVYRWEVRRAGNVGSSFVVGVGANGRGGVRAGAGKGAARYEGIRAIGRRVGGASSQARGAKAAQPGAASGAGLGFAFAGLARPWTRVNNCTDGGKDGNRRTGVETQNRGAGVAQRARRVDDSGGGSLFNLGIVGTGRRIGLGSGAAGEGGA